MPCLKCGRETENGQVFCGECLAAMESCPVKPGTVVVLPTRNPAGKRPNPSKQTKPDERIRQLEKKNHHLRITISALCVALILVTAFLGVTLWQFDQGRPAIGQNYSTVTTAPGGHNQNR